MVWYAVAVGAVSGVIIALVVMVIYYFFIIGVVLKTDADEHVSSTGMNYIGLSAVVAVACGVLGAGFGAMA